MTKQAKIFFPNLDGLRFVAFFLVFFHHTIIVECFTSNKSSLGFQFINAQKDNGALGVNLFFVLSGFLITYLLLSEKMKFNTIHIAQFYMRRVLRIWPLYFLTVLIGFVIFPFIKTLLGGVPNEIHTIKYYAFFASNFEFLKKGFADSSILNALWSVGVEEQFYLIWPIILFITPVKHLVKILFLMLAGTLIFRYFNKDVLRVNYMHTFSVIGDMIIGGIAAWLSFYSKKFMDVVSNLSKKTIAIIYVIGGLVIMFNYVIFTTSMLQVFERLVYALFFVFIIVEQNFAKHSFYKMSNNKFLHKWGNYTYGLYCLHSVGLLISHNFSERVLKINNNWYLMLVDFTLGLGLTMIIAYLSYTYFESPFLKLKEKFSYFVK